MVIELKTGDIVKINEKNINIKKSCFSYKELFIVWDLIENSSCLKNRWIDYYLKKGIKYELRAIYKKDNRTIISEESLYVRKEDVEEYEIENDEMFAMIYDAKHEFWKHQVYLSLNKNNALINYRFKIGDLVLYRENLNDNFPYNDSVESTYIVSNYIKDSNFYDECRKKELINEGYLYEIRSIDLDFGFGKLGGSTKVKEEQLKFYTEKDMDVIEFYHDALSILLEELEKKGKIPKRWDISYKYCKFQPVIYRKEHSNLPFDFNKEPICFINNRISDIKSMPDFGKDKFFRQRKKYQIFKIYKGAELTEPSEREYVKEEDLILYEGDDKEVINIIRKINQPVEERKKYLEKKEKYKRKLI